MSKNDRAVWRAEENGLQIACENSWSNADAMRETYDRLAEHYESRSVADRIGGVVDKLRGR